MDFVIMSDDERARAITESDLYRSPEFFRSESDRGVVLAVCAIIERMLANLLGVQAAAGKPRVVEGLLNRHGAFATFAAKIDWLASVGVLNEAMRRDLHRLEALRARCVAEWASFAFDDRVTAEVLDDLWARRAFEEWCPTFANSGLRRFWNVRDRFEYFVACQIAVVNRLLAGDGGKAGARRRRWRITVELAGGERAEVDRTMSDVERCLYELVLGEAVRLGLGFRLTKELSLPAGVATAATVERKRKTGGTRIIPAAVGEESRATMILMRPRSAPSDALEPRLGDLR
jgi:hypothetical protein